MPLTYSEPNRHQVFEDLSSISDLGRCARPHRLMLAPAMQEIPQMPLFNENSLPRETVTEHYHSLSAPPVYMYGLPNHELGGFGLLQSGGRIFLLRDIIPEYYFERFQEKTHSLSDRWALATFDSNATVLDVDYPVAVPLHPNLVYGHFLLEMFPKLHLLSRLRRAGAPFAIAVANEIPDWAKRIISLYFDDAEIVHYNARTSRVRSPCFILPSMMNIACHFHPDFNLAIDEISDFVSSRMPASKIRRVWLSRRRQAGWRCIANLEEVEDIAVSLGFTIIHPQDLSFPEQIALMHGAECIACEYGSATHNSLFARRGTRVFCINRINWYQSGIGRLRSQTLAYLPPADGRFRDWRSQARGQESFEVDGSKLREQLARFADGLMN